MTMWMKITAKNARRMFPKKGAKYEWVVSDQDNRVRRSVLLKSTEEMQKFLHTEDLSAVQRAALLRVLAAWKRAGHDGLLTTSVLERPGKIKMPPGTFIASVMGACMTQRAYRRWFYPALAEMQAEYFEALHAGKKGRALWIHVRGTVYLVPGWLWGLMANTVRWWFTPS